MTPLLPILTHGPCATLGDRAAPHACGVGQSTQRSCFTLQDGIARHWGRCAYLVLGTVLGYLPTHAVVSQERRLHIFEAALSDASSAPVRTYACTAL
jgi:hypothetical protein